MEGNEGTPLDRGSQAAQVPGGQTAPALPEALIQHLAGTGPWVRFMAVLGFIGVGFMVLGGLTMVAVGSMLPPSAASAIPFPAPLFGLLYLVMAAVYVIPLLPLNRFASSAGRLRRMPSSEAVIDALRHSRSFWRRVGILSIVGIAVAILGLIVAMVVAVIVAASRV